MRLCYSGRSFFESSGGGVFFLPASRSELFARVANRLSAPTKHPTNHPTAPSTPLTRVARDGHHRVDARGQLAEAQVLHGARGHQRLLRVVEDVALLIRFVLVVVLVVVCRLVDRCAEWRREEERKGGGQALARAARFILSSSLRKPFFPSLPGTTQSPRQHDPLIPACPCASGSWSRTCPSPACPWPTGTCSGGSGCGRGRG